jgi:hypothetical protein
MVCVLKAGRGSLPSRHSNNSLYNAQTKQEIMIMEYDIRNITDSIAEIIRKDNPDLDQLTNEQSQALLWTSCINPTYGRWIDIGVDLIFSALDLEDSAFADRFPSLSNLSKTARQDLIKRLQDHIQSCRHCSIKHDQEMELNTLIDRALEDTLQIPLDRDLDPVETHH